MILETRKGASTALPADSFFTHLRMDKKQFQLRRMTEDDLDTVDRIERSAFQSPWSRRAFLYEVNESQISVALVASVDKKICGYIVVWFATDELHIGTVAVDASWRRRGIATTLLKEVFRISNDRQCKRAYLEVRRSNVSAQRLYDSFGFRAVGVRPGYYSPQQEDAIVMAKPLHGAPVDGGEEDIGLV